MGDPESTNPASSGLSFQNHLETKGPYPFSWVLLAAIGVPILRVLPAVYPAEAAVLIGTQRTHEKSYRQGSAAIWKSASPPSSKRSSAAKS